MAAKPFVISTVCPQAKVLLDHGPENLLINFGTLPEVQQLIPQLLGFVKNIETHPNYRSGRRVHHNPAPDTVAFGHGTFKCFLHLTLRRVRLLCFSAFHFPLNAEKYKYESKKCRIPKELEPMMGIVLKYTGQEFDMVYLRIYHPGQKVVLSQHSDMAGRDPTTKVRDIGKPMTVACCVVSECNKPRDMLWRPVGGRSNQFYIFSPPSCSLWMMTGTKGGARRRFFLNIMHRMFVVQVQSIQNIRTELPKLRLMWTVNCESVLHFEMQMVHAALELSRICVYKLY